MSKVRPLTSRIATIAEVFSEDNMVPAAVQRDYKWEEQHCRQLLDDIDRVFVTSTGYNPTLTLAALSHRAATLLAG